jgi:hypothetical protein
MNTYNYSNVMANIQAIAELGELAATNEDIQWLIAELEQATAFDTIGLYDDALCDTMARLLDIGQAFKQGKPKPIFDPTPFKERERLKEWEKRDIEAMLDEELYYLDEEEAKASAAYEEWLEDGIREAEDAAMMLGVREDFPEFDEDFYDVEDFGGSWKPMEPDSVQVKRSYECNDPDTEDDLPF